MYPCEASFNVASAAHLTGANYAEVLSNSFDYALDSSFRVRSYSADAASSAFLKLSRHAVPAELRASRQTRKDVKGGISCPALHNSKGFLIYTKLWLQAFIPSSSMSEAKLGRL